MNNGLTVETLNFKKLKNINFSLNEGTIITLLGKTGSGKTTLLKCLYGLFDYEGIINFKGDILTKSNIDEIRKKFSLYLGISSLTDSTVFLNIMEPLKNLDYPQDKSKKKVYEITKKLGIENLLYKEIKTLSYAQKKIVCFAQSIVNNPKVILVDGLFESLDKFYKKKVIDYLLYMKKNKKSIIIFTTNNSEDLLFADNLIIIKNGKILINDELKKLIEDERIFSKNDIKLPFIVDLSHKLKSYELIDNLIYNLDEMVDEIW